MTSQRFIGGFVMLALANIGFSTKAVIIKLMYRYGVDTPSVIALRMLFSVPFFIAIALWRFNDKKNVRLTPREWGAISSLGILSYYISSMLDFLGLQYVTAAMERLVLYTYPTIVLVISAFLFKKKITRLQYLSLALTYAGIILIFVAEKGLGLQKNFVLGVSLVFSCAITYAFYVVFTGEYVHRVGSVKYTCYAAIAATVPALVQSLLYNGMDIFHYPTEVYVLSGWLSIAATVLPLFMIVEGIRLLGANDAGIVGFIGPVSTIFLAYFFLDEPITPIQLAGTAIVLAGIFILSRKK